jgi:hypothetical protein
MILMDVQHPGPHRPPSPATPQGVDLRIGSVEVASESSALCCISSPSWLAGPGIRRRLSFIASSNEVDLESLLPDVWIAAHPEHFLTYRRDEAEAAASARRRRRVRRRTRAPEHSRSP